MAPGHNKTAKRPQGLLAWLIARYRETPAWTSLSLATRRQRENIFRQVIETAGRSPYRCDNSGRDCRRPGPPRQDTISGAAFSRHHARSIRVGEGSAIRQIQSGGGSQISERSNPAKAFPVWTEDDVAAYEARWPLGTRQRVWLAVLLYTGLRRGDAVRLGRQHVRDGVATIRTREDQAPKYTCRSCPSCRRQSTTGRPLILLSSAVSNGKPMTKESFGNAFSDACRAAGVNKSAHGLRKIGATRAANNGATVAQLNAIFGWSGSKMATLYTANADRARLAREHMDKMRNKL